MIARLVLLFAIPVLALGQDTDPKEAWAKEYNNDDRWNDTDVGPFVSSVLRTSGGVIAVDSSRRRRSLRRV